MAREELEVLLWVLQRERQCHLMDLYLETYLMLEAANTSQCELLSRDWKSHTCTSFGPLSYNRLSRVLSCISKMHALPQTTTQKTLFKTCNLRADIKLCCSHAYRTTTIFLDPLTSLTNPLSIVNLSLQFLDWMKKFPSAPSTKQSRQLGWVYTSQSSPSLFRSFRAHFHIKH